MTYPTWKYGESYAEGDIVWDAPRLYRQLQRGLNGGGIFSSRRPSVMAAEGVRWEVYVTPEPDPRLWKPGESYAEGDIVWDAGKLYRQIDRGPNGGGIVASIRPAEMAEQGVRWEVYDPNATSYHPWQYGKSYTNGDWVIFDGHYYRQRDDYRHSDTRSVFKPNTKTSRIRWADMGRVEDYADPRPTEHRVEALEETVAAQGKRIGKLEMRPHPWEAPPAYGRSPGDVFLDLRDANLHSAALAAGLRASNLQIDALAAENKRLRFSYQKLQVDLQAATKPGAIKRLEESCVSLHAEVKRLREKNRVQFDKLQAATKALRG